jgi:hypothetical protein
MIEINRATESAAIAKRRKEDRERNAVIIQQQIAEREDRHRERGERMTGHSIHDDPGPYGDYNESEQE